VYDCLQLCVSLLISYHQFMSSFPVLELWTCGTHTHTDAECRFGRCYSRMHCVFMQLLLSMVVIAFELHLADSLNGNYISINIVLMLSEVAFEWRHYLYQWIDWKWQTWKWPSWHS